MTKKEAQALVATLSRRELQVASGIANGFKPATIAQHLGLSVKTVSTFRQRLLKKLCLGGNAELVILMYEAEIVKKEE